MPGVVTNAGGAYNPDTSTFTCPATAYYYIYFSLCLLMRDYDYNACHITVTMDDSMIVEVRHRDKYYDGKQFFSNGKLRLYRHQMLYTGMWNSKWLTESAFGYITFDDT